jgi:hypothetical protein
MTSVRMQTLIPIAHLLLVVPRCTLRNRLRSYQLLQFNHLPTPQSTVLPLHRRLSQQIIQLLRVQTSQQLVLRMKRQSRWHLLFILYHQHQQDRIQTFVACRGRHTPRTVEMLVLARKGMNAHPRKHASPTLLALQSTMIFQLIPMSNTSVEPIGILS